MEESPSTAVARPASSRSAARLQRIDCATTVAPSGLQATAASTVTGDEIVLTLPYPVSANVYWRSFTPKGHSRAIVTLSEEAKAYKAEVGWLVKAAGVRQPIRGRVHVHIDLYPQRPLDWAKRAQRQPVDWDDTVRCIDLDNARKVLYDSLKGLVMEDDSRVWADSGARHEPDGEARVVVTIRKVDRKPIPQLQLL